MTNYKYRCKDGLCGAEDCDRCHPHQPDWEEEANQADLDNDARWEKDYLEKLPRC